MNIPRFISRLSTPRGYLTLLTIVLLYGLAFRVKNPFIGDILTMTFLFGSLSLSWNILGGYAGQFSLGHAGFFGIGAYTSTLLLMRYHLNPWLGMIAGGVLAAIIGGLVFYPCFKLRGIFFCLATLAFNEVLKILAIHLRGLTGGAMGITIPFKAGLAHMMFRGKTGYMIISLSLMILMALVTGVIEKSRFGYKLTALREDEDAAEMLGINGSKCKLIASVISAFFVGVLGTLYAHYTLLIDPESVFSVMLSVEFALLSIIGGLGNIIGPILGAFLLIPLDSLLRGYLGGTQQGFSFFAYGTLLIVVVLFLPRGIMDWLSKPLSRLFKSLPEIVRPKEEGLLEKAEVVPRMASLGQDSPLLEIRGLSKSFGGLQAIKKLDITIRQGEIVGLIGPNGAGKTTLFNLITGFYSPDGGTITFKKEEITGLRPPNKICKRGIGRTFQIVKPFGGLSVMDNVVAGAVERAPSINEAKQKSLDIIDFVGLGKFLNMKARSLTLEGRKRMELARALATDPELLLLDEVMAGLNPREIEETIKLIRNISQRGVTILVIEHVMKAIMSLSDHIVVIHHGEKIFEGKPQEVIKDEKVIKAYLGRGYGYVER